MENINNVLIHCLNQPIGRAMPLGMPFRSRRNDRAAISSLPAFPFVKKWLAPLRKAASGTRDVVAGENDHVYPGIGAFNGPGEFKAVPAGSFISTRRGPVRPSR